MTVRFEAQGAQTLDLFDGHEGDVDVDGGYHVVVRKAVEKRIVPTDPYTCAGELPIGYDDDRVLIRAKSAGAP